MARPGLGDVYLTIAAYNERAQGFYARRGFVVTRSPAGDDLAIDAPKPHLGGPVARLSPLGAYGCGG